MPPEPSTERPEGPAPLPPKQARRRLARPILGVLIVLAIGLGIWASLHARAERSRALEAAARAIASGKTQLQRGRPDLALRAVSAIPDGGPRAAEALTIRGMALVALGRVEESREALERSWELNPAQPMAAKVLAAIYFSRSETDRGLALLNAAARLDPKDFRPWYARGDVYRRIGRPQEAADAFREALRRLPGDPESSIGLAWALLKLGKPEEAGTPLETAMRAEPGDPRVLGLDAQRALLLGRADEAIDLAGRCLLVDPGQVEALLTRARALRGQGRHEEALRDAERAVALAPNTLPPLHLLALTEAALGLEERSAATSERHRALNALLQQMDELVAKIGAEPDDPGPRWRLGQLAARSGELTLAEQSFRAALAIDPGCRPAAEGLAALGRTPDPDAGPGSRPSSPSGGP